MSLGMVPIRVLVVGIVGAALTACAPLGTREAASGSLRIFREVIVGTGQQVRLGETIAEDVLPLVARVDENRFRLRPRRYSGAESIEIVVGSGGRVKALHFGYSPQTDYEREVRDYTRMLGPPRARSGSVAARDARTRWEDRSTTFEMIIDAEGVRSVLSDRTS